jgi:hypothetical protein
LGVIVALLFLEILLRVAVIVTAPVLPRPLRMSLREVKANPFAPDPVIPGQWRLDAHFGKVDTPTRDDSVSQKLGPRVYQTTTINWMDPNSDIGFRVPSAGWQPRWPVDAVIVGDSFTFCWTEYTDCWVQQLDIDHGLSVVNLGLPKNGSLSHERLLETFGLPYKPHMVIWQWYGNDFNDDYGLAHLGPEVWWSKNSADYQVLDLALQSVLAQQATGDVSVASDTVHDGNIDFTFGDNYTRSAFDLANPHNQEGLALTRQAILKARDVLAATQTPLVIVLIPAKEEVYRPWVEKQLGSAWLDAVSEGRNKMLGFCRDEKLICLDATPSLIEHANQREMVYWPDDFHLNPLGNHILSDTVWDFLTQRGLAH